ncbi:uncharacterized protein KD926_007333 [Aspergillus affinis]|uniref:uncharacterized protein n=1 Tax=Aspergillus affinis TaxID=1070780 RepID=UPI0022FE2FAB|nr:uncharacterized protein KD926_007333 [Aspergillus affinis]KAI9041064.1 hypothetical protein KD926_007333 [Aspergillus affinis]
MFSLYFGSPGNLGQLNTTPSLLRSLERKECTFLDEIFWNLETREMFRQGAENDNSKIYPDLNKTVRCLRKYVLHSFNSNFDMRLLMLISLLCATLAHGQKCGMAMQVHRQGPSEPGAKILTPKEPANQLLESVNASLMLDYIRCEGDNGSCLVRLDVEKAHAEELKAEFDLQKTANIEVTDAFCPDVKSEL